MGSNSNPPWVCILNSRCEETQNRAPEGETERVERRVFPSENQDGLAMTKIVEQGR